MFWFRIVTAALSADFIGRSIAQPLEVLTEFAVRVSEGERRAVPPPAHGREVQSLSKAIDSMRRQLEGRPFVETFAADLSHELKNPVAAIRASAEVLADGALDEPEEAAETPVAADSLSESSDPVRLYLKEMGNFQLLSREQEVEIAKRIEAGEFEVEDENLTENNVVFRLENGRVVGLDFLNLRFEKK